jgi:hypothetical protein
MTADRAPWPGRGDRNAAILISALLVLTQVTDAMTTNIALGLGGTEANPIMDRLIQATTPNQFVAIKAAIGVGVAAFGWRRNILIGTGAVVFAAVTISNLSAIGRLLG